MKNANFFNQTFSFVTAFLLLLLFLLAGATSAVFSYADVTEGIVFDRTAIEDDLGDIDYEKYPFKLNGTPAIYSFTEHGYHSNKLRQENFAIYVYVYNPTGAELSTYASANKINVATDYTADGEPRNFENLNLTYLSHTTGDYNRLFYKFKVTNSSALLAAANTYAASNAGNRRYDVAGLQLWKTGDLTATDNKIGMTYIYSGYSAGYGSDTNTLQGEAFANTFETVTLDVNHTYYRFDSSSKGEGYQSQLDTVYFRVPNRLLEEYGKLQRIKAEWYEYKTKEIVVTQNEEWYNAAKQFIGIAAPETHLAVYNGFEAAATGDWTVDWGWVPGNTTKYVGAAENLDDTLHYLFYAEDISNYDPYGDVTEQGGVESNALYDYILTYTGSASTEHLPIKDGKTIPAALFEDDIDDSRKIDNESGKIQMGYSYYDFDADVDLQTLKTWQDTNPSFWDNWLEYGLYETIFGQIPDDTGATVSPIYQLKDGDLNGTAAEVADKLLINANDVSALRLEKAAADLADESIILFRFATSEYSSVTSDVSFSGAGMDWGTAGKAAAYVAQASVFFDFDVIQLTFKKVINGNTEYTYVPVIANPIDIIPDITPPPFFEKGGCANAEQTLMLLGLLLLVVIIVIVCMKIYRAIRNAKTHKKVDEIHKNLKKK